MKIILTILYGDNHQLFFGVMHRQLKKHFTLDKSDTMTRDDALSATTGEFRQLLTLGAEMENLVSKEI